MECENYGDCINVLEPDDLGKKSDFNIFVNITLSLYEVMHFRVYEDVEPQLLVKS